MTTRNDQNRHKAQVRLLQLARQLTRPQESDEGTPLRAAELGLLFSKAQQLLGARYFGVEVSGCPHCLGFGCKAVQDSGAGVQDSDAWEPESCLDDVTRLVDRFEGLF